MFAKWEEWRVSSHWKFGSNGVSPFSWNSMHPAWSLVNYLAMLMRLCGFRISLVIEFAGLAAPGFVPSPPRKRKLNWSWRGPSRAANKIKQVQNADEEWCLWHPVASHGMSHGALPLESFRFTSVTSVSDPSLPSELCSQHRSDFEPAGNTRIMKNRLKKEIVSTAFRFGETWAMSTEFLSPRILPIAKLHIP